MGRIAIIGRGWVGSAMFELFPDSYIYTRHEGTKEGVNECDVCFICVPTPLKDGWLDISAVEESVKWCECPLIVIRSTVNPGTCDYLANEYDKRIVMQPEYLGETPDHPKPKVLVIGGKPADRRELINLYTKVYNANQPLVNQDHVYFKISRDTSVTNDFAGTVTITAYEIIYQSKGLSTSN